MSALLILSLLGKELFKRIVSEIIHIKKQFADLNKQSDTDLSESYTPIICSLNSE